MSFRFQPLSPRHAEAWQALRVEGARDFPMGFLLTLEETLATPLKRCREILGLGGMYGVFDGTKLVGFAGYRKHQSERIRHRTQIGPFFVTAAYQGRGAAQALMRGIIDDARESGLEQIELYVDTENRRAISFYEKQGFERVATHPDMVRVDGEPRDDHFYRLLVRR